MNSNYINRKTPHQIRLEKIAFKHNVKTSYVELCLKYLFEYIELKINKTILHKPQTMQDVLTKEEFDKNYPVFKIPVLGFLRPNYRLYYHINKRRIEQENKNK